jgi:6-pyruvoyltetrahydropterin/6-carboxytetrahydropterin synthase
MRTTITRETTFDSAHRLDWHEGKCHNLHGHTYRVQVTVAPPENELEFGKNGIVMDFADLGMATKAATSQLDHQYLNDIIENPTGERIARWLFREVKKTLAYNLPKVRLVGVRLWETPDSFVTVEAE